jgi:carboxylesterase type B
MAVTTLCYKRLDQDSGLPLYLDIHHPSWKKSDSEVTTDHPSVPAVVYFHGGGLTVGNRNSWLPNWLKSQCNTT